MIFNEEYHNIIADTLQLVFTNLLNGSSIFDQTDSFGEESCKIRSSSTVKVNDINEEEITSECIIDELNTQSKGYAFATANNSIIVVSLNGNLEMTNQYLPAFEESIRSIQISNPGDITTSELYKKYKESVLQ